MTLQDWDYAPDVAPEDLGDKQYLEFKGGLPARKLDIDFGIIT